MSKPARLSKEDYKAQKQAEQREMLAQAVERLTTSEGWLRYLDTRSRFHNYSFNNIILIALQRPEAEQIASAKKWREEFNRNIIKGEKAIKILAPIIIYEKDESGKPKLDGEGKKIMKMMWFKTVPVFDVSQTEGEPVPARPEPQPLTGDSHEEYGLRAIQFIEAQGASVAHGKVDFHWTQGTESGGLTANIDETQAPNHQTFNLIRAAAEIVGNDVAASSEEPMTSKQIDVVMSSAAYVICQNVGLDTSSMTVPHIATWADDDTPKKALAILREFATKIDEVSNTVTEAIS